MKLDIGCGKNKAPGYHGVDAIAFEGVDTVMNVVRRRMAPVLDDAGNVIEPEQFDAWPWASESIEDIHCSHFVEHLTREEWVPFFNEAYRVLMPGGQLRVITPHFAHACAYGDPTHKSFLSEWVGNYLNRAWRESQAPHSPYTCDFDVVPSCSFDDWMNGRHIDVQTFAVTRYINSARDLILTCTKRKP